MRGEHNLSQGLTYGVYGSAPRARGTPVLECALVGLGRISPACAGNTNRGTPASTHRPDQPRVRGEHCTSCSNPLGGSGSAPRARGTPHPGTSRAPRCRISPACAGNTWTRLMHRPSTTDQPRVRGEHHERTNCSTPGCGSAPRARGTRSSRPTLRPGRRISPACAGNTSSLYTRQRRTADQPRVRGEHSSGPSWSKRNVGSAPRARGTPDPREDPRSRVRISPACAGNTSAARRIANQQLDQPRVRGEHGAINNLRVHGTGSAPRARGTHVGPGLLKADRRISPACAGNTVESNDLCNAGADQPRVRGEHLY